MLQKKIIITLIAVSALPLSVRFAYADNLSISGNGDSSSNSVNVSSGSQNNILQSNSATVNNSSNTNSSTGNNQTNSNSDQAAIQTGNSNTTANVTNNVNQSQTAPNCTCSDIANTATIKGNGDNSTTTVDVNNNKNTQVTITNNATITNIISGTATTGNNIANHNSGNVSIQTGNITVKEQLVNNVNDSHATVSSSSQGEFDLKFAGNGVGSTNTAIINQTSNTIVTQTNNANIFNNSLWNLVTGNNTADKNNGSVNIRTGDIDAEISLTNNVNSNSVIIDCGCTPTPPPCKENCGPTPPPNNPPSTSTNNPGSSNNSSSGSSGSSGGVTGTTTQTVLPATGNPWMLLAILGNLLMLLFGAVLRLRSGRSPGTSLSL